MKRLTFAASLLTLFLTLGGLAGCGNDQEASADTDGTFEEIGESVDNTKQAAEETAESAEETAKKVEEAADGDGNE